jgi:hypothetical protein
MLHELSSQKNYTGIWIAKEIASSLHPYAEMDENPSASFLTKKFFDVIEIKQTKNIFNEKTSESLAEKNLPKNMKELWEIAYMCFLMKPYFPRYAFLDLFCEAGKNPALISRAFEMLAKRGIIDSPQNPEIIREDFAKQAETILGEERISMIKGLVRSRLLAWVNQEKLLPSFTLLKAIIQLDGKCDENLILDAIYRDIIDGVFSGLQNSIELLRSHQNSASTSLTIFSWLNQETSEVSWLRQTMLLPPEI